MEATPPTPTTAPTPAPVEGMLIAPLGRRKLELILSRFRCRSKDSGGGVCKVEVFTESYSTGQTTNGISGDERLRANLI